MKFYSIWLALICIGVFIIQVLIPGFTEAFILNQTAYIQLWRFLTAIFLHGSLTHLLYNLFALVFFGLTTEKLTGSRNFILLFIGSGVVANIISVNFYASSLGASGAIYGIIGLLTVLRPLMTVFAFSLPMPMFLASILWTTGNVLGAFYSNESIGYLAHLSGIVVGLLLGIVLRRNKKKSYAETVYQRTVRVPEEDIRKWEREWMGK